VAACPDFWFDIIANVNRAVNDPVFSRVAIGLGFHWLQISTKPFLQTARATLLGGR
jgi:hypothetical protein